MDDADISRQLQQAQLRKLTLEIEQLTQALERQRAPARPTLLQFVPLLTALISVAGFLWGVFQYVGAQEKDRDERGRQSLREKEIAEREFMKPWLESQRGTYTEALEAAATIATTRDAKERSAAEQRFWRLYQGRMIMVETTEVSGAMKHFGACLDGTDTCPRPELAQRTRALASALSASMAASARVSYEDFARNQFRYDLPR